MQQGKLLEDVNLFEEKISSFTMYIFYSCHGSFKGFFSINDQKQWFSIAFIGFLLHSFEDSKIFIYGMKTTPTILETTVIDCTHHGF